MRIVWRISSPPRGVDRSESAGVSTDSGKPQNSPSKRASVDNRQYDGAVASTTNISVVAWFVRFDVICVSGLMTVDSGVAGTESTGCSGSLSLSRATNSEARPATRRARTAATSNQDR